MQDIGSFADWVTVGAAGGVKAFFGVFVFGLFCAACIGVLSLLNYATKGGRADVREEKRRPY